MTTKVKVLPNNAFIISPNKDKGIYYTHLDEDKMPEGSQPYFIEWLGKWMHIIIEREQGIYERYNPEDVIKQTPGDLIEALRLPANAAYWAVSKSILEKLAIGAIVAVIVIGMILMFAMTSGNKSGASQAMLIVQEVLL